MTISVGIPTYKRSQYLLNTIESVLNQHHPAVCEIIVLDQTAPPDKTTSFQKSIEQLIKKHGILYLTSTTANLPRARNEILCKAKGEILLWLDDDVILPEGFIDAHWQLYQQSSCNKQIMGVAGLLYQRNISLPIKPSEITQHNFLSFTTAHHPGKKMDCNWTMPMIGANHSVLKSLAIATAGYDEQMIGSHFYEDADFTKRLLKAFPEKTICYNPDAFLVHLKAPAGGCRIPQKQDLTKSYQDTISTHIYMWRHHKGVAFWKLLKNSTRIGPLRKIHVIRFWRQPLVWFGFLKSLILAYEMKKPVSIFTKSVV